MRRRRGGSCTALATWLARNGASRRRRQSAGGAGGTADGAEAGAAPDAAALLRDDELHRESDRHGAATSTRNIKRWRDGDMRRRWIGLGLLRAAERFRRIKRHGELDVLVTALGAANLAERAA